MNEENSFPSSENTLVPDCKSVCMRLGGVIIAIFVFRYLLTILWRAVRGSLVQAAGVAGAEMIVYGADTVFLFILPIAATLILLKFPFKSGVKTLYAKPRYMARSLGMFPALYGLSILTAFLMMMLSRLFSGTFAGESMGNSPLLNNVAEDELIIIPLIYTVIFAPLFEEFWFRGVILQTVRPFGNGFAIFISALMFSVAHSNLFQFSYTFAAGVVFGYVTVQTGSIIPSMVMHFFMNSIATVGSIVIRYSGGLENLTVALNQSDGIPKQYTLFTVWMIFVMILAVVGIIMAIVKLAHIKRYKLQKVQTEISTAKLWGIFLSRITVIIGLALAVDIMVFGFVYSLIYH